MPEKIAVPVMVQGRVARVVRSWTRFPAERYVKKLQDRAKSVNAYVGGHWVREDGLCHFEPTVEVK